MLKIEFATDYDAFINPDAESKCEQDYARNTEIKRVLKNVCNQLDNGASSGSCVDINGNTVGRWEVN